MLHHHHARYLHQTGQAAGPYDMKYLPYPRRAPHNGVQVKQEEDDNGADYVNPAVGHHGLQIILRYIVGGKIKPHQKSHVGAEQDGKYIHQHQNEHPGALPLRQISL